MNGIYRPPLIGILAFMAVLVVQPLGHIIMIVMEEAYQFMHLSGGHYGMAHPDGLALPTNEIDFALIRPYVYWTAFGMGAIGIAVIYWGVQRGTEIAGTWAGFIGGTLLWTGWIEFSLHYHSRYFGVKALCANSSLAFSCAENPATKPEYFLMQGSVGFLLAIGVFFLFNRETRCNAFRWVHRVFRMNVGKPTKEGRGNYANIVAAETIGILWFFYVLLMFLYDPNFFGERHWVTYAAFFGFLAWSLYLINRLVRYSRMTSALRYAVPTAIIFWNSIEIVGRWDWFKEFWIHPFDYPVAASATLVAMIGFTIVTIRGALDRNKTIVEQD